jgi:hypothetical protein
VFFSDKNTIVSKENRKKILDFLVRQYVPVARLENIEAVSPNAAKKIIEDNKIATKTDGISDTEWKNALETQQKERNKVERRAEL